MKIPEIKVFGVGGSGCRLMEKALGSQLRTVTYYAVDSDCGALRQSNCENKIRLTCQGCADYNGADVAIARRFALENESLLVEAVKGADLVIVLAGLGNGIESAVAPLITDVAKQNGAIAVAIVATPFPFEGEKRLANAEEAITELKEKSDMTVVISEGQFFGEKTEDPSIAEILNLIEENMWGALRTIVAPVTEPSQINADYEDVAMILKGAGSVCYAVGVGTGEHRATEAVKRAKECLPAGKADKAKRVIICVENDGDLTLEEASEIANDARTMVDGEAFIQFATACAKEPIGGIKVSILVSGGKNGTA